MEAHQQAAANGHASFPAERVASSGELSELRAAYRRQARVIDTLTDAIMSLRTGAIALKADNTDLRGELDRVRGPRRLRGAHAASEPAELADIRLRCDVYAPVVARAVLVGSLRDRVPASVLDHAQLLASELVTNSVLHCGASPADTLVFRVELSSTMVRLEVEDPGRGASITRRPPDVDGGGFGLNLVDTLSASWGVERAAAGTRVWAQLALATGVDPDVRPDSEDGV
jgi:anti-sigma regulatory factor (Ser/Thr protein kinase)